MHQLLNLLHAACRGELIAPGSHVFRDWEECVQLTLQLLNLPVQFALGKLDITACIGQSLVQCQE